MRTTRVLTAALAAVFASGAVATSAVAATAPSGCPEALPTTQAVEGLTGTGYTVEKGTTPDTFSAQVIGRITDGIGPGVDMIMANLESPAITRAGGVWAGMSGSPVYAPDGKLIGAVAYGLASNSPIAGITPAADMKKLLATVPASRIRTKSIVPVTTAQAAKIAATGEVTAKAARGGFSRLPLPLSVSGTNTKGLQKLTSTLEAKNPEVRVLTGGARATATIPSSPSDIVGGGNYVAALAYGDATLAATGTTTYVCGSQAVAFGHPFLFSGGNAQYSLHTGSAVYVQPDLLGSFKVANPGGVVGVVDSDRLAGIRGRLGATPSTYAITSEFTVDGVTTTGSTTGVYQDFAGQVAAVHTLNTAGRALDSWSTGSADVTITVSGKRKGGRTFSLSQKDHVSAASDLDLALAFKVAGLVSPLLNQDFEDVTITGVSIKGTLAPTQQEYRVAALKARSGKTFFTPRDTVTVRSGGLLTARATLVPFRGRSAAKVVDLTLRVPGSMAGDTGLFSVEGGSSGISVGEGPEFGDGAEPTNLDELLTQLRTSGLNDILTATLTIETATGPKEVTATTRLPAAVKSYSFFSDAFVTG